MELIKNTRDWRAQHIWVETEDRAFLVVRDDGEGMDGANRNAFASVNMTTAGTGQSGTFCTGTKQALYSLASMVKVLTAPTDDPGYVYEFSFTADGYEQLALSGGTLRPRRVKKTKKTWPFEHSFGTQLVYTLRHSDSRRILRGTRLAKELAARLPLKFKDVLFVDGASLPAKEIIGRVFHYEVVHPQLGQISMEIYRPKKRSAEEDLRLTGVEIGEAPISSLFRVLGEYRDQFPLVFLLREVCGTLAALFLGEYAMEDRRTIRAGVVDDPRIVALLEVLSSVAEDIAECLDIRMTRSSDDGVEQELETIREICNRRYAPGSRRSSGEGEAEGNDEDDLGGDTEGKKKPPISLSCRHEFEVGEEIAVRARLRSDLDRSLSDLNWYDANSRATGLTRTDTGVTMMAAEVGTGTIRADLPGTLHSVVRAFQIVHERVFRLSVPYATVPVAGSVTISGVNSDKLTGELDWSLTAGAGEIEKDGNRVTYTAPAYRTAATLVGYDRANPGVRATCVFSVVGELETLCIRGVHFLVSTPYDAPGDDARPVTMEQGGDPHEVTFNKGAPGFKAAFEAGRQRDYLLLALAQEFPSFSMFVLDGVDPAEIDPRDVPVLLRRLSRQGFVIYQELLEGQK